MLRKILFTLTLKNLANCRIFQFFGDISYSLYLWHWVIWIFLHDKIESIVHTRSKIFLTIFIISTVFAIISYYIVEKPTRKINLSSKKVITAGICMIIFVIAPSGIVYSSANNLASDAIANALDNNNSCFGARSVENKEICENVFENEISSDTAIAASQTHNITRIREITEGSELVNSCEAVENEYYCLIGNPEASHTILFLGDSHAIAMADAIYIAANENNFNIRVLARDNCVALPEDVKVYQNCTKRYTVGLDQYLKDADAVIMTQKQHYPGEFNEITDQMSSGIEEIINKVTNANKKLYLIEDNPKASPTNTELGTFAAPSPEPDAVNCIIKQQNNCWNDKDSAYEYEDSLLKKLSADGYDDKFTLISMRDLYCDDEKCYFAIGGTSVYSDAHHLSRPFSISSGSILAQKLASVGLSW